MKVLLGVVVLSLVLPAIAVGDVYKCETAGEIVYQDRPCDDKDGESKVMSIPRSSTAEQREAAEADVGLERMKAFCREKWPDDYSMQTYCMDRQKESARKLQRFVDRKDEAIDAILVKCASKWQSGETYDFAMFHYCTERQVEAMERMR